MRDLLTGLAIVLLVCLTGALIAPHLIDWESRRNEISDKLSALTGQTIQIDGAISIQLLPTPTLKLSHVRLGRDNANGDSQIQGSLGRFKLQLAVPPLLRGEIRISEASLQGADIVIRPSVANAAGANGLPPPDSLSFQKLQIGNSRIRLITHSSGEPIEATGIEGNIEATSLLGPYRGVLAFDALGDRRSLRFSTGRIEAGSLRPKALVEHQAAAARSDYDGVLRYENGAIAGEGVFSASGTAPFSMSATNSQLIWRMSAKIKGQGVSATMDDLEVAFGNADRQTIFTGNGDFDFTRNPVVRTTLSVRQFDLDKLLSGDEGSRTKSPESLLREFARKDGVADRPVWLNSDVDVSIGSLLIGGDVVVGPRVVLQSRGDHIRLDHVSGEFPGRTTLRLEKKREAIGSAVEGRVSIQSRDLARLTAWFQGTTLRPLAVRTLNLQGDLAQDSNEISISDATLMADDMRLGGSIIFNTQAQRPKLILRLNADQLDIAKAPDIAPGTKSGSWDLDLAIDARRVRFSGVGAGEIHLRMRKDIDSTYLDELKITDLGGAHLTASGVIDGADPRLTADLKASRLESLLELASKASSHPALAFALQRAAHLAPADLKLNITPDKGTVGARRLDVKGRLNTTILDGWAKLNQAGELSGPESLQMRLVAPSPDPLMRQIGVEAIPVAAAGAVDIMLKGGALTPGAKEVPWSLNGFIGGLSIAMNGHQVHNPAEPFKGKLRLSSDDLSPLAQTILMAVPAVPPGQAFRLESAFDLQGYRITFRDLDMKSGGAVVKGEIAFDLAQFGRVAGQLRMNHLDAASFMPLIFGEPQAVPAGEVWRSDAFAAPAGITLPGDLFIEAERLTFTDGFEIAQPRFVLRFESGLIYLEYVRGQWSGGALNGQATLRRSNQTVSITAKIDLKNAVISSLPLLQRKPVISGMASGQVEINAVGDSPAKLVAAVVGNGRVEIGATEIRGVRAGALTDLLDSVLIGMNSGVGTVTKDDLATSFSKKLSGSLQIPSGSIPLSIGSGVLRIGPSRLSAPEEDITLGLAFDMRNLTLGSSATWVARNPPKAWNGPPPRASLLWRGTLANPVQEIDVTALSNGLIAVEIEREQDRIQTLEQDQRERALFNRRLRASEEQRRREEEEQRLRAEAAKQAAAKEVAAKQEAERQALRERVERAIREAPPLSTSAPPPLPPPLSITPQAVQ